MQKKRARDFHKLWAGQTVSLLGGAISFLAIPLAAEALDASPLQMGVLGAAGALPALVFGLSAGAWIDRVRRKPVLVWADIGRGVLLALIPLAALLGVLRLPLLYAVALGSGLLGLFSSVALYSYLPTLLPRDRLAWGNSRLEVSRSAAEIFGEALAGLLVQWFTAPIAILLDALSFFGSAGLVASVRSVEPTPTAEAEQPSIWRDTTTGLRFVMRNPPLRAVAGTVATLNFFNTVLETVWILYLVRRLGLSAGWIGLVLSIGGVGFLVGALFTERLTRRLGLGRALVGALLLIGLGDLLTPLAAGSTVTIFVVLCVGQILFGLGLTTFNASQVSLRQSLTPDAMQGRMHSVMHVLTVGIVPLGALVGGVLGEAVGLRATLFVAVAGELSAVGWLVRSPVWGMRRLPEEGDLQVD